MDSNSQITVMSSSIVRSILSIILGIILVKWPDVAVNYLVVLIGVIFLVVGTVSMIAYFSYRREISDKNATATFPFASLGSLLFGLLLVAIPSFFVSIMMVVLGIVIVVAGVGQLGILFSVRRSGLILSWVNYLLPILILICGVVILLNPFSSAEGLFFFFGIVSISYGIIDLFNTYSIRRRYK